MPSPVIRGTSISLTNAKKTETFYNNNWSSRAWKDDPNGDYPIIIFGGASQLAYPFLKGGVITLAQAKKQATYASASWQFGPVWAIKEDISYPTLIMHTDPGYDYLMNVRIPDGIVHIAIRKAEVSDIRVKMHDGTVCSAAIVDVNDPDASVIRVSMPNGIFALKQVVI